MKRLFVLSLTLIFFSQKGVPNFNPADCGNRGAVKGWYDTCLRDNGMPTPNLMPAGDKATPEEQEIQSRRKQANNNCMEGVNGVCNRSGDKDKNIINRVTMIFRRTGDGAYYAQGLGLISSQEEIPAFQHSIKSRVITLKPNSYFPENDEELYYAKQLKAGLDSVSVPYTTRPGAAGMDLPFMNQTWFDTYPYWYVDPTLTRENSPFCIPTYQSSCCNTYSYPEPDSWRSCFYRRITFYGFNPKAI